MDPEPDVIHRQIDETRESLTEKLETLEGQVKATVHTVTDTIENVKHTVEDTIEGAKTRVEDTVESVKDSVKETVANVKETFNLSRQVERHPWGVLGCSFAAGAAAGYLVAGRRLPRLAMPSFGHAPRAAAPALAAGYTSAASTPASESPYNGRGASRGPGMLSEMLRPFEGELSKLKGVAIGALVALARDALKNALPPALAGHVDDIMNNAARHAGGETIREPLLAEQSGASRTGY